ncbi:DUF4174 domain-containing protein [Mycoplana rhizolycopersici]|uniref:DUF4174 domain-containing protein n=1 Tax=Mycoplana rhizolycopersici TaxID=2746702 RepID=A0ABX2QL25_9HYPH|nr:DUF4174 domain-containing protein [Rhizobium rhizolycopersici]NVP58512.1 DUF4174 domain-containing protein [Rhizobium rhizolycopersici]
MSNGDRSTLQALGAELGIGTTAASKTLREFRGKCRVLVVFEELSSGKAEVQEYLIAEKQDALQRHNVAIIRVAATGVFQELRPRDDMDPDAIRSELGGPAADKFEAVLLGADGLVRMRTTQPIAVGYLLELIDKFPSAHGN